MELPPASARGLVPRGSGFTVPPAQAGPGTGLGESHVALDVSARPQPQLPAVANSSSYKETPFSASTDQSPAQHPGPGRRQGYPGRGMLPGWHWVQPLPWRRDAASSSVQLSPGPDPGIRTSRGKGTLRCCHFCGWRAGFAAPGVCSSEAFLIPISGSHPQPPSLSGCTYLFIYF